MVQLLLDTHTIVWWLLDSPKLPASARRAIGSAEAIVHASAASAWEIATKVRLGKMPEMAPLLPGYATDLVAEGFRPLPIDQQHSLRAGSLPGTHGDPFDRIIAAQALLGGLAVVTRDRQFATFGCEVIW